jgi:hypothetical protein
MIYGSYKATQFRAMLMRARGRSRQEIKERLWDSQHEWAGRQMYKLCIDLRGFYLKVRGSRGKAAASLSRSRSSRTTLLQVWQLPAPHQRRVLDPARLPLPPETSC